MSNNITQYHGDCREVLKTLPDLSVNCCVTSPPYFGLRDYGVGGQIGLEPTPEEFVSEMVGVFGEVRRVLKDDGTLWLNLGDSYVANASSQVSQTKQHSGSGFAGPNRNGKTGLLAKNMIGVPWRVAFALQADGWFLRQDIIWSKPNPMPESVVDRCTKAHEYIFLLSKSPRYYYDNESIKEAAVTDPRKGITGRGKQGSAIAVGCNGRGPQQDHSGWMGGDGRTRNRRSVWTVCTHPYPGSHFAVFPEKLIEPCILAGCPEGGTVLDPFGGSGTTARVAIKNRRKAILIELNGEYIGLQNNRTSNVQLNLI